MYSNESARLMKKLPFPLILISLVYILVGAGGVVFHLADVKGLHPFPYDVLLISLVGLIAVVSGIYMLRGANWARWGALAWIAFHVVLSAFHSWIQFGVHSVFFAAIAYFLFRPEASRYFRPAVD
jgi:hypothetical protein